MSDVKNLGFVSTRGYSVKADACEAVLNGIAPDGGLYTPETLPRISADDIRGLSYPDMAKLIIGRLLGSYSDEDIADSCDTAYTKRFSTPDVCPLKRVGDDYVLELFHGETAAFKDIALSILPLLMVKARRSKGRSENIVILTATSGDTGSAAMNGFRGVPGTGVITFYPKGGVSEIQHRQMTCMTGDNITACSLNGNFDACQTAVKRAFAELNPPSGFTFSSANSINIARLVPQIVYYYAAYDRLIREHGLTNGDKVDFIVPTGNFGDILAGCYAKKMGLPIGKLVCASNSNNVLTDFINTGVYDRRREFFKTISPSMDILVSSNLERLIYHAENSDCEKVAEYMSRLSRDGVYKISDAAFDAVRRDFVGYCCDDSMTLGVMKDVFESRGYLPDPHTAVGFAALKNAKYASDSKARVVLATASPFKFAESALKALGIAPTENVFDMIDALSEAAKIAPPDAIGKLRKAEIVRRDDCDIEHINEYIMGKVAILCQR